MASKFFYAHVNRYGVGTTFQRADGQIDRLPGAIYRFQSAAARDAFVEADVWNGRYHREAVPASAVRARVDALSRRDGHVFWSEDEDGDEYLIG